MESPFFPGMNKDPETEAEWFSALINLTRFLRSPEGCPWDREHNAGDFARFSVEEGEELTEALASGDNSHAEEEFGDCLFTLLSCVAAAEAEARFSLKGALQRAHMKMMRRHEHVFRKDRARTPEEAMQAWQQIKKQEKAEKNTGTEPKEIGS
ncbi:MAG TPA: MazG nucleotide pyrophosphohydrolase domain-containing protein [Candidatus Hydrogenedentes bacterium]|nr:MAG: Nucleoside triphosphate pyrophosphohydrolase [Candidatus Hydrogenedentes bacterium ADurb.Bin170]HOD95882.1 MazG nucleotide pyrophosphohydrolase domain-containing protein [Candidatus Hydrogenedentota bacterium]HOH42086.1 MazG nucleotide pyrophosphohydrolase domain-containing protein [Candidatus Hydrogenedentota bacterium]HOM47588.1 MazG nucleotide pyrophosphohydrolase domain-containing protein [Candidatus Hydrogenedentota bacterium]HOR51264.1 MazG nucleotide pyrophosphohydrolase domain-c